ncbi:XRE family transcriptional regulator [Halomonas shantousis]
MRTGVVGFQPARLGQLRRAFNLTQKALAEKIGRAVSNISKWEKGHQAPEADVFNRICEIFGVSSNWLLTPTPLNTKDRSSSPFFFRSQTSATKTARELAEIRLQWMQEISYELQESIDWPELNVPHLNETDCRLISDEEIEEMADHCRDIWGLSRGPIPDIVQAMENAGIICSRAALGHLKMDGVSNWSDLDGRPYVLISSDKANGIRNRFDVAHELGHIVLHKHITKDQYNDPVLYKLLENQAHRFASAFLMPSESFPLEISWPTLETFLAVKSRWKVSIGAMIARCRDLEITNEAVTERLWKGRSARGWVKQEPLDKESRFEQPKLLMRGVHMLVDHQVLTKHQLRDILGLPTEITEELCNLRKGYFDISPEQNVVPLKFRKKEKSNRTSFKEAEVINLNKRK